MGTDCLKTNNKYFGDDSIKVELYLIQIKT